jgi:hypothetical protein
LFVSVKISCKERISRPLISFCSSVFSITKIGALMDAYYVGGRCGIRTHGTD